MQLLSADDEFVLKTLQEVPGCLGKLEYLNGLRDERGQLGHWGLEKIHGARKAKAALEKAYQRVLGKMLQTPMRELWNEYLDGCEEIGEQPHARIRRIQKSIVEHMPDEMGPAQQAHINLVLDVLCLLAEKEQR